MRSSERLTVPIVLDRTGTWPLQEQLVAGLRRAIHGGLLPAGSRLPSTRTLSQVLGISRGVAMAAYQRLYADGTVQGTPGSGTYVSASTRLPAPPRPVHRDVVDLRPGQAITEGFPLAAWRSAWRQASHDPPPPGHPPARGLPELRAAIADHMRRVCGYAGTDHEVIITGGARHGLRVLLAALGSPGIRLALADPGPRWWHDVVPAVSPVPLHADGPRVPGLPVGVDGVLVAPEGNAPLGVRMSPRRRSDLAEWSARTGGWLVEVGRDVPVDPRIRPLPSLLTLGPARHTVLIGDLRELLTPAVGLGYLAVPRCLADPVADHIAAAQEQPVLLSQRAAAELFRTGILTRRSNQLAAIHARKIAIVCELLGSNDQVELLPAPELATATVLLPDRAPVERLARRCRTAGILLAPLHEHYLRSRTAPNGLVLGIGHLEDTRLRAALRVIRDAM